MSAIPLTQHQDTPANAVSSAAVCAVGTGHSAYYYGYWFSYGLI